MITYIAKCGCNCLHCPTYKGNLGSTEERQKCSAGWEKYLNIKLSREKLRACDGCNLSDPERKTYYLNCKIRKCAIINNIDNCAYCKGFPCDELLKTHSVQNIKNREDFIKQMGKEISEEEYNLFIKPYTGLIHLTKLRQTLSEKDFKDYKKFSSKTRFAPFKSKRESLENIYILLTTLCIEHDVSYARSQTLEHKREHLIKLLWATGSYGNYNKDENYIELDSNTFMSQKIQGFYHVLLDYLKELKKYDIHGEVIPLIEKGWLTPMGGLRREGWIFRLKFGDSLMGEEPLFVFQDYIKKLNTIYGAEAYKKFTTADLSIMYN